MATRAIKPRREETMLTGWQSLPEQAPSLLREDQPTVARILSMAGVMLTAVGALAMLAPGMGWSYVVGPGWGGFFLSIGLVLILYHAFVDRDLQFRRVYMGAGLLCLAGGVVLRFLPLGGSVGQYFLPYGIYALTLALLFLVAVLRHEDDANLRGRLRNILGIAGAVMILVALVCGQISTNLVAVVEKTGAAPATAEIIGQFNTNFLSGEGVLYLLLGLLYVGAFIGMQDPGSDAAYRAAVALGVAGAVSFLITLARVLGPAFFASGDTPSTFLVPSGLILLGASALYIMVALAVCVDWPVVVLVRRELAAFFYSPMAYLVFLAMMLASWINFQVFLDTLAQRGQGPPMLEPIVSAYVLSFIPLIVQLFVVPVLTMRLVSEEKRTGTLEMLLTAPVNEATVIVSKFMAAWLLYLLSWVPTWLFLVGMRAMGADEFDYRPVLSFLFALAASGAGFVAMGLFFSSVTRNQIIAAVFTFVGMITFILFAILNRQRALQGTVWGDVFYYASFYDLWESSLEGVLAPRYLVFHLSVAIFFLFLSNKVLEARKWS